MPEHCLVRQVLLNCVKPTHDTLFADVPNLSIENATKMSKDRKLWSSNRPSLRCQPLSGGVEVVKCNFQDIQLQVLFRQNYNILVEEDPLDKSIGRNDIWVATYKLGS